MVIRKYHPLKFWLTMMVILMTISIVLPIGVNIWYTRSIVHNECQALNLLKSEVAPKPTNPAANPSRVFAYNFHADIVLWANSDGC